MNTFPNPRPHGDAMSLFVEPDQADVLLGTPYHLGEQIGRGSVGAVHEAEHVLLGTPVVVKLLHSHALLCPSVVERFRIEASILTRLAPHPNIVRLTDFGVTSAGTPFLVMERLSGRTLKAELATRGPLPVSLAIDDMRQALAGLDIAHQAGVVHRDVKLANLFVCDPVAEGRRVVKVLDFGIAKILRKLESALEVHTEEGLILGTPTYLAPEQALCAQVDARTDVYGVAMCLYRLVAGRGPFAYCDPVDMLRAHAFEEPPPPSRFATQPIPDALDRLVLRALAKRPGERPEDAARFAAELLAIRAPEGAHPSSPPA